MLKFAAYLIEKDDHIVNRVDLLCADESEARTKAANLAVKFDALEAVRWLSGLLV